MEANRWLRKHFAGVRPEVSDRLNYLKEWNQISVLSRESDRLPKWHRPGLLMIGDASDVMSPVAGGRDQLRHTRRGGRRQRARRAYEGRESWCARTDRHSTPPGMADAGHPGPANADAV